MDHQDLDMKLVIVGGQFKSSSCPVLVLLSYEVGTVEDSHRMKWDSFNVIMTRDEAISKSLCNHRSLD